MSIVPDFFGRRRGGGNGGDFFDPFGLVPWDPFEGFPFNNLEGFPFNNSLVSSSAFGDGDAVAFAGARVDWKETPQAHVFKADLPGVRKEEVKVEVEDGRVLQISGERTREQEESTDTWHRVERSSGRFLRRFRLPEDTEVDRVKAAMENGVLTVTVPKTMANKPNLKAVEISG